MRLADRRLSGEDDLEEDQCEGPVLYKKEGAHASVVVRWVRAGFHTGSVVVVVAAAAAVVIAEASHKHREGRKWDP
jgi:hypothetical protein